MTATQSPWAELAASLVRAGEQIDGIASRDGNWLPLTPDAKYVQNRDYHADYAPNPPGSFVIERLGGEPTAPPRLNDVRDAQAFAWGTRPDNWRMN